MKKHFYLSLSLLLLGAVTKAQDGIDVLGPLEEKDLYEIDVVRGDIPFYKQRAIQSGAAAGGVTGATVGGTVRAKRTIAQFPEEIRPFAGPLFLKEGVIGGGAGALGGAAVGAGAGALLTQAQRRYRRFRINRILNKFTMFDFQKLSRPQAAFIYAAYQKNLPLMKKLTPHLKRFIARPGVWEATTALYTKKAPTEEAIAKMQFELLTP